MIIKPENTRQLITPFGDADQGVVPAKEMPDVKSVAQDLKGKGYTRTQVKDVINSLQLDGEATTQLLKEFPEENVESEALQETSTKTSIATNPKPLPREENPVQTPMGSSMPLAEDLTENFTFSGTDLIGGEVEQPSFTVPQMKEQVFIASQLSEGEVSEEQKTEEVDSFIANGFSPLVSSMEAPVDALVNKVEEQVFMSNLSDNPVENAQAMKHFLSREERKPKSKHRRTLEQYYTLLPQERTVPEDAFSFLATHVDNLNALSAAASIVAKPLEDKKKLIKDAGEVLTPFYGEAIFLAFQDALSEDNVDTAMQLLVGSSNLDKAAEKYFELDADGQADYLNTLVSLISERETAAGTDNEILKLDLLAKIFDKITESKAGVEGTTSTDVLAQVETFLSEVALVTGIGEVTIGVINDAIRAKKLHRLIDIIETSPVDLLEKPKSFEGEWFGKDDPMYPNSGTGTALDEITTKSPSEFEKLVSDRDIKDVTDSMGVAAEDMPRRILPRFRNEPNASQADGVNHHFLTDSLQRKIDNNHLALQLQEAEVNGLLPSFIADLSLELGMTATPHLDKSYFDALDNPTGDSLGDFVVRLGDGKTSGFKTATDARNTLSKLYGERAKVVRKTPYGNFSDDLMEGTNAYGEYFIELRQPQATTPKAGLGNFLGDEELVTGGGFKPLLNHFVDDDYLFNDKIQTTFSNMRDRANAFGVELGKQAEPLIALATNPRDVEDFNKLAIKMQARGIESTDPIQLTSLLGRNPSKKVIDALDSARTINTANWAIKNRAERAALVSDRYKTALIGENRYISKPLIEKPDVSSIKGKEIYDPESNTQIPLTQEIVDGLYEGGGVVAKLYKNAKTETGQYTHIIVRNPSEQIKELQPDVLPYIKGHYAQAYKDGDGFVVTGVTNVKVNGKNETQTIALGIAKTKREAEKLAVGLANRGHTLTKKSVVPTGEYVKRHGFKTSGGFALEQSMSRGEILKGIKGETIGPAELVDPFDVFVQTLHKTRSKYEQDSISLMKKRWVDRYRSILKVPAFPADIPTFGADLIFKDRINNEAAVEEAKNFFRRISLAEGADMERASMFLNNLVRRAERLADKKGKENLASALSKVNLQAGIGLSVGLASTRFIWGNPLFQVLGVAAQAPFMLSQGPVTVARSMLETAYHFAPLMMMEEGSDAHKVMVNLLAREKGVSEERVRHELKTILDSGIVRTADLAQDYLSEQNMLFKTLLETKATRGTTVALGKALKLPIKGLKGAVLGSIDTYELLAFMVAKNLWLKSNKGKDWTEAKAVEEITRYARGLSLNQNDTARYAYQNNDNPFRFAMAMTSYTNRMATRMYIDPLTGGLFSKALRPKGSRGVNPYVASTGAAIGSALIGFGLYGEGYTDPLDGEFDESEREYIRAIAAGDFKTALTPETKEMFKAMGIEDPSHFVVESYYRGLQTSSTNALFDGDVNWTEKFHPASYIKMMYDKVIEASEGNFVDTVFGLPYAAAAGLINTTKHNAKMALALDDIDSNDALYMGLEMASQLKIVDDSVAAYMAVNLGRRVSKSTFSQRERTTLYEQLSKLAGGIPTSEFYNMINMDASKLSKIDFDTYTNFMIRKTQMDLYNKFIETGENLLESQATEIITENYRAWAVGLDQELTQEAKKEFRMRLMMPEKPVKYGDFTITRSIQEQGLQQFQRALQDESPYEWRRKVVERLGVLELQIKANPQEVALKDEKAALESMLREIYDKDPKELNKELIEEGL